MAFSPTLLANDAAGDAEVRFVAPVPAALTADVWPQAVRLAEGYWERLAAEPQFSTGLRAQCSAALAALRAMPQAPDGRGPVTRL